jgi:hypothetical protein
MLGLGDGFDTLGGNPADLIYLGGTTSTLTFQGANGDDGIGILSLSLSGSGNFDVAQAGATLNISASLGVGLGHILTKTGAGTINVSNVVSGLGSILAINGGTANFLPAVSVSGVALSVNNQNTGVGNGVTLNLQSSQGFRGLSGTIVSPSAGTNTATVNLVGTATELALVLSATQSDAEYFGTPRRLAQGSRRGWIVRYQPARDGARRMPLERRRAHFGFHVYESAGERQRQRNFWEGYPFGDAHVFRQDHDGESDRRRRYAEGGSDTAQRDGPILSGFA